MRRALIAAIVITSLRAPAAGAQTPASCSFDTAAHTVMQTVNLALSPNVPVGTHSAIRDDYLLAAQALQPYVQVTQLSLPLWARVVAPDSARPNAIIVTASDEYQRDPASPQPKPPPRGFVLSGHLLFRLNNVGQLADSDVVADTPSPDLNAELIAAVKRAALAQAFSPPSREVLSDRGSIPLRVMAPPRATIDTLERSVSVLRLAVPTVVLDSAPEVVSLPRIRYPDAALRARVTGQVVLRMVVLPDGTIDRNSLVLVQANNQTLASTARTAFEHARFRPARIGSCALAAITFATVDFRIIGNP